MPGITLYTGNRLEILADRLTEITTQAPLPPLTPETIIVQNPGMARWLTLKLAENQGVWANSRFPLPNKFIREIFRLILPDLSERSAYSKDIMIWHLMEILPEMADRPGFAAIKSYLADSRQLKRFQLAGKIAELFDLYTLFRPDLILAWDKNSHSGATAENWQCLLWRELSNRLNRSARGPDPHQARLLQNCLTRLNATDFDPAILPPRIIIFGVSALPPYHLKILQELAGHIDVLLFLLNPCSDYWDDIKSGRDISKISRRHNKDPEELYLAPGNSLLASMGKIGRDFLAMLHEFDYQERDFFQEPATGTLLGAIQQDILHLIDRGAKKTGIAGREDSSPETDQRIITDRDDSICLQSCHGPMREIEVLKDHLLDLLDKKADLQPRDILVSAPDIEFYAPFIQAVFDTPTPGTPSIPYRINARDAGRRKNFMEAFFAILDLPETRLNANQIFTILERETVRKRFGIDQEDLPMVRKWIEETRIRWGIDQENRRSRNLPAMADNTWQAGIDRMLLGYAMAGGDNLMFADILPYDQVEGAATEVLGKFIDFCSAIFKQNTALKKKYTIKDWVSILIDQAETFFPVDDETEKDMRFLRKTLLEIESQQTISGFSEKLDIEVVRLLLLQHLENKGYGAPSGTAGMLSGGVNFSDMQTMRAVPFKVICLIGMNDKAYPRPDPKTSFDLTAQEARPGDRSRRLDDRYLFLESILSARRTLYISYIGQSLTEDSLMPPSVLVNELLDYIEQGYRLADPSLKITDHLITRHCRHPFNPKYFVRAGGPENDRFFSYEKENCKAAGILLSHGIDPAPLLSVPLAEAPPEWKQLTIEGLANFFCHPTRFFLNHRFGVYLAPHRDILEDRETFTLKGLERYKLETNLLDNVLAGRDPAAYFKIAKAAGRLPHGRVGEHVFREISGEVKFFKNRLDKLMTGSSLPPLDIDLELAGFRLYGRLDGLRENGMIRFRSATIKPKDRLRAWILHLALNAARADSENREYSTTSILAGKKETCRYQPVPAAREILEKLLRIYWQGLRVPPAFLPKASYDYAECIERRKSEKEALDKARQSWQGSKYSKGEQEDEYCRLYYKNIDPINGEFGALAKEIYGPLLAHQEKIS